jgi:hypothetical protein
VSYEEENKFVTLEWIASPMHDMFADAVMTCILQVDACNRTPRPLPGRLTPPGESSSLADPDTSFEHFKECVMVNITLYNNLNSNKNL